MQRTVSLTMPDGEAVRERFSRQYRLTKQELRPGHDVGFYARCNRGRPTSGRASWSPI